MHFLKSDYFNIKNNTIPILVTLTAILLLFVFEFTQSSKK